MNRRALIVLAAGTLAGASLRTVAVYAQRASPVRVTREEPLINRIEFDPRRPPPDMPPLTPPESGVCKTTFELSASLRYSAERLTRTTSRIYVDALDIVTRLRFDIYTIENAPPKLRAHEEGHRAIGEHYYRDAATIAENIGRRLIGKTFDGSGVDEQTAQRDAFDKAVAQIEREYMARVRIPSAAANERFDEITRHGLDAIDETQAVAQAIGTAR